MSMGIGHFALGASGTRVMIQMLPLRVRLRIRIAQVFIVLLGGAWALFPDLSKHAQRLKFINVRYWTRLGLPNLDRFINLLSAFHDARWANISFLHRALDIVDDTDSYFQRTRCFDAIHSLNDASERNTREQTN